MQHTLTTHQAKAFGIGGDDAPSQNFPVYNKKVCLYWDHKNLHNPIFKNADIRIHIQSEPEQYRRGNGMAADNAFILSHQNLFDLILTWDINLLEKIPHSKVFPFGTCRVNSNYNFKKDFILSFLPGSKRMNFFPGHNLRYEVLSKLDTLKVNGDTITPNGLKYTLFHPNNYLPEKDPVFDGYQFSVVIENSSHYNYFSEKIMDCFASRTIPIYWGCKNINNYFNMDGILTFNNWEELSTILHNLTPQTYQSMKTAMEDNFQRHFPYVNFWERVRKEVKKLLSN